MSQLVYTYLAAFFSLLSLYSIDISELLCPRHELQDLFDEAVDAAVIDPEGSVGEFVRGESRTTICVRS